MFDDNDCDDHNDDPDDDLDEILKGWRPCLLGLLNPRLELSEPDHTGQRASLPHRQGGDK